MNFTDFNLNPEIIKAIELCGYTTPTPVQAKAIPAILEGKDVVASAQTGTGKTAAFVLPALHHLGGQAHTKKTRILILTPTRELANQITKAAMQYGKFLKFNIVNLVGGMPYHQQIRELQRGADIIVATPGRLLDHIEQKRVNLSSVDMLILDEADRMLDMGFIEDVEYIAKLTPEARQTLMFSATVDKQLTTVVRHLLKTPVRIDMSNEKLSVPLIEQQFYKATSPQHKMRILTNLLKETNVFKAIIFTATKIYADKIADRLCEEGFSASALHGDLRQNVRNRTIDQLKSGRIQFLVATDVAARGIDISDITHVINYDLPRFCEDYVHRIGRTGRAGKTGVAISFVLPSDNKHLQRIERYTGQHIKVLIADAGQHESTSRGKVTATDEQPADGEYRPQVAYRTKRKSIEGDDDSSWSEKKPYKKRDDRFGDKPFKRRDDHKGFGEKSFRGRDGGESRGTPFKSRSDDSRSFGHRDEGDSDGERSFKPRGKGGRSEGRSFKSARSEGRPSFQSRSEGGDRLERRPFKSRSKDGRSDSRPFKSPRFGDKPEGRSFRPRDDSEKRPFKSRSEGGRSEGRPFKSRFGDKPEGRSFRPRDDNERSEKRPFKSRSEGGRSEGRPFKSRFEGERSEGRSFKSRGDGDRSDGRSFKSRGDGDRSEKRSFKSRGDGDRSEGRSFKPRGDGDRSEKRPFKSRSEGGAGERSFKPRGEGRSEKPFGKKRASGSDREFGGKKPAFAKKGGDRPMRKRAAKSDE